MRSVSNAQRLRIESCVSFTEFEKRVGFESARGRLAHLVRAPVLILYIIRTRTTESVLQFRD